jgi:hypothetical protein
MWTVGIQNVFCQRGVQTLVYQKATQALPSFLALKFALQLYFDDTVDQTPGDITNGGIQRKNRGERI